MVMVFFGKKWDAPAFEDAAEVCVLPGRNCLLCEEPVLPEESGILMNYISNDGFQVVPEHIECHLRSILGSVEHLNGTCSCTAGGEHSTQSEGSYRDQARATMALILTSQRGWGYS